MWILWYLLTCPVLESFWPSCEVIDDGEDMLVEVEVSLSGTKSMTILSNGHSGISVICRG